jgi:SAM-dependent methyltransferase
MSKEEIRKKVVGCPECHSPLMESAEQLTCGACGHVYRYIDHILMTRRDVPQSYFDDRYETMAQGNHEPGVWSFCYENQVNYLRNTVDKGAVVIDVGCGPAAVYGAQPDWYVIGVEPSLHSLRANVSVDLKVFGTADRMPLVNGCADVVTCFYSVHHMVGERVSDTTKNVAAAMKEFRRVLRPGGSIIVFDMSPWWLVWLAEKAGWNIARKVLGGKLDMFFWHWSALRDLGGEALGNVRFDTRTFNSPWHTTFPPVFSAPWFRLPRFLYPMGPRLYHWKT